MAAVPIIALASLPSVTVSAWVTFTHHVLLGPVGFCPLESPAPDSSSGEAWCVNPCGMLVADVVGTPQSGRWRADNQATPTPLAEGLAVRLGHLGEDGSGS